MAKENLRGASKAGRIAITRWVLKDTIEALKRLRGQGSKAHPTEGEIIDEATALFEIHRQLKCGALAHDGKRQCQLWGGYHGDEHVNFEIGLVWPIVQVLVGEGMGDSPFRGAKLSDEEQREAAKQPVVIDDLGDRSNMGTDSNPDMSHSMDYFREPPVYVAPNPSMEYGRPDPVDVLHETDSELYKRVTTPSPLERLLEDKVKSVAEFAASRDFQVDPSTRTCVHCQRPMPLGSMPASTICKDCFLAGHRNGNCGICFLDRNNLTFR